MSNAPVTLRVVAGWAAKSGNPRYVQATRRLEHIAYANRGRIMVAKGAQKIATFESPQSAISYLEQQIIEIRTLFPQQPQEQPR